GSVGGEGPGGRCAGEDRGRPGQPEADRHRVGRRLPLRGGRATMKDVVSIFLLALLGTLIVAVPGWALLRLSRGRSITLHICVLIAISVLATLAAVIAVARGMFVSAHDLHVLFIVLGLAGTVTIAEGFWLGRQLAADAMWAEEMRIRERQMEASRRELVAWVSHDLRTPLAGLRAMAEALE